MVQTLDYFGWTQKVNKELAQEQTWTITSKVTDNNSDGSSTTSNMSQEENGATRKHVELTKIERQLQEQRELVEQILNEKKELQEYLKQEKKRKDQETAQWEQRFRRQEEIVMRMAQERTGPNDTDLRFSQSVNQVGVTTNTLTTPPVTTKASMPNFV